MARDREGARVNGTVVRLQPLIDARLRALAAIRAARRRIRVARRAAIGAAILAALAFLWAPSWPLAIGAALLQAGCGWVLYQCRWMARDLDVMDAEIRRGQARVVRIVRGSPT